MFIWKWALWGEQRTTERECLCEHQYLRGPGWLCWLSERRRGEKSKDKDRDKLCLVYHWPPPPTHTHNLSPEPTVQMTVAHIHTRLETRDRSRQSYKAHKHSHKYTSIWVWWTMLPWFPLAKATHTHAENMHRVPSVPSSPESSPQPGRWWKW